MTRLISLLIAFLLAQSVLGQAPDTLWTRTYGSVGVSDFFESATMDENDNIVAVGGRYSGGTPTNGWVQKISPTGDALWSREFSTATEDMLVSVTRSEGGYVCAGLTHFPDASGDFWFLRLNENGDSVASKAIGFGNQEICIDIINLDNGNFLIFGQSNSLDPNWDGFVAKVDSDGDTIWTKFIGGPQYQSIRCAVSMQGGGAILVGETLGDSYPTSDVFLTRIDGGGATLWTNRFGSQVSEVPYAMCLGQDSTILVCGAIVSAPNNNNAFVWKFDSDGDSLEIKSFGGADIDEATSLIVTPDNGIAFTSVTRSFGNGTDDFMLTRLDSNLDSLWSRLWLGQGFDAAWKLLLTSQFQYVLVGTTSSYPLNEVNGIASKTKVDSLLLGPVVVISPPANEVLGMLTNYVIDWIQLDSSTHSVSISLNRHYPIGLWEVITSSTENDGEYAWFVTDPLSDSCRIRICAVQDTFCDISDGNFSIVSSQGYLALVKSNAPSTPVLSWNAGETECPASQSEWFRLKNFGSEAVVVFQPLEPTSAEFSRTTECGSFFALAPNQMSACSLSLSFAPSADGTFYDTLQVQTDAVNGVGGYVKIPLSGEQISTPASPQVVILPQDEDVALYWSVVDTSLGGCAVSVERYLVFYSPSEAGPFYYHGWTAGTSYTHVGVVTYAQSQFYQVVATDVPAAALANLREGMEMGEALGEIENSKSKCQSRIENPLLIPPLKRGKGGF